MRRRLVSLCHKTPLPGYHGRVSHGRTSAHSRFWVRQAAVRHSGSGVAPMMSRQADVPRLPIPTLEDTCARYLDGVQPLVSSEAFAATQAAVDAFACDPRQGPALHADLVALDAAQGPTSSWLAGMWDSMYLEGRWGLPINSNPSFVLKPDPAGRTQQLDRAAATMCAAARFQVRILQRTLEPDMERADPLDMSQYDKLFAQARIPLLGRDRSVSYGASSGHAIVMCRNHMFSVKVLDAQQQVVPEPVLRAQLRHIQQEAANLAPGPPVGVLTTADRDLWARARAMLVQHEGNAKVLDTVDRSLFVVCLDEESPSDVKEANAQYLHKDGHNRWFDKFSFIHSSCGTSGFNLEHAPIDGHTSVRLFMDMYDDLAQTPRVTEDASHVAQDAQHLPWHLTSEVEALMAQAQSDFDKLVGTTQTDILTFDSYGSGFMKSVGCSPDAFMQLSFQLAYYKLMGTMDSVYESANTKRFMAGRTETVRSVTNESLAMCKLFADPSATDADKVKAFHAAAVAHVNRMKLAKAGQGVDRILFGMKTMAAHRTHVMSNYETPELFTDPSYTRLTTSVLSTSNSGAEPFTMFSFGPVVGNGLGIGYQVFDPELAVSVSSFEGRATEYAKALRAVFAQLQSLMPKKK